MRRWKTMIVPAAVLTMAGVAAAQSRVFTYPEKGQTQQQQDIDTAECTRWANSQTGVDPSAPPAAPDRGQRAAGTLGGAAKGAAVGAAVGAIAGDAGKGAGIGAVAGGVGGRRGAKAREQAQAAGARNDFDRAFAACMESRGYRVK